MPYEPLPSYYDNEHRYAFEAKAPAGPHVVVSGRVHAEALSDSDTTIKTTSMILTLGPWLIGISDVVPYVSISEFWNHDADEDDEQAWSISKPQWDTIGPNPKPGQDDEERVRLKFDVGLKGEASRVGYVSYYVFIRARQMGKDGLKFPVMPG